jgi:hypothetical protein
MYRAFLGYDLQEDGYDLQEDGYDLLEDQNVKQGNLDTNHNIETRQWQHERFLLRFTSLLRFLRESEPEIERRIGEMDKASHFSFSPLPIPRLK